MTMIALSSPRRVTREEIRRRLYNLTVPARNWWAGAFGRRRAFIEGRDIALAHAAMIAHDMGRPDIQARIMVSAHVPSGQE